MVRKIGTILKQDYCTKCFNLIEWDAAKDQFTSMGNRYVICPNCGSRISANDAKVVTDSDGSDEGSSSSLPEVTSEDNGKVLTVVNGSWDKANSLNGGLTEITYAELKALRDNSSLTPGMQYRITDYICTVANDENAQVESHPYDIIVTADSESVLNENARACMKEGDNYYHVEGQTNAALEAWELKYCLDNDTNRFQWADAENGKGVVYYLKDDRNNECWYDFKQIKFKRFEITAHTKVASLIGKYIDTSAVMDGVTVDSENPKWFFTFSYIDNDNSIVDSSIRSGEFRVNDNNFAAYRYLEYGEDVYFRITLPRNVFIGNYYYSNTFGGKCYSNTFGNSCFTNTFGGECYSNTFGDNCYSNTFGDGCYSNTFGNYCSSNTFGVNYSSNTFGNNCGSNTFSDNCTTNTFGNGCSGNIFGNDCVSNTFSNYCNFNTLGDTCGYLDITTNRTRYYNVLSGVSGTEQSHTVLQTTANNSFVTYVGNNSQGTLKYYCPMDSAI